ncbi:MAG: type II toxin-antitoxin system HicA family toxin [Candidatus Omnitrophica bacterium]|nr:type II toxin-antitoxin system HicA family toxin [Candidatus Omnitrophota bacterium]
MPSIRPIHYKKFEKFVLYMGCRFDRQIGDHRIFKREGLLRPVVVRTLKDLPKSEIKSNLRTLNITSEEYLKIIENL